VTRTSSLTRSPAAGRLDRAACARLLQTTAGSPMELQPEMLAAVGPRAILARMLTNLDYSFRRRKIRTANAA